MRWQVENLAPEPFRGVGAAAFGEVLRAHAGGERGDFRRLGVAGVVLPEPGLGGQIVGEFREQCQGGAVGIDRDDGAAGGVDADADDAGGVEGRVGRFGLGEGSGMMAVRPSR